MQKINLREKIEYLIGSSDNSRSYDFYLRQDYGLVNQYLITMININVIESEYYNFFLKKRLPH